MHQFQSISVIGLGYIGLPTAALFARSGIKVLGVDVNPAIVETINSGEIHIVEPGLQEIVSQAVGRGLLTASIKPEPSEAYIVAVPTPFRYETNRYPLPDLSYVESAVMAIAPVLRKGALVLLESTSPVGTTELVVEWLSAARPDLTFPTSANEESDVMVAYCPERVLPGQVIDELVKNDRVIGGITERCAQAAAALYRAFLKGKCVFTDARTAEMCKLTENAFRDVNIAFANELSNICDELNIDVWKLIETANLHPRVNILKPGPGVGGHCIAVDPWFIVSAAPEKTALIRTAREVNDAKPERIVHKIVSAAERYAKSRGDRPKEKIRVACFGLSFKPDIDDLRESPAVRIVERLIELDIADISVVEPHINCLPARLQNSVKLLSPNDAANGAQIIVILVAHGAFKAVTFSDYNAFEVIDVCGVTK